MKSDIRMINGFPVVAERDRKVGMRKKRVPMAELGMESLKPREREALKNKFALGMRNKDAALEAGYPESKATHAIPDLLRRKPIVKALEDEGITDAKIAKAIAEGLEAMHPAHPKRPDHIARRQFVSEANKIRDNYPAKRIELDERRVVINMSGETYAALQKYNRLREPKPADDRDTGG